MIKVYVTKQSNYPVSVPKIKSALTKLFTSEGIVSNADVSVSIVGKKKMLALAKKYLHETGEVHNVLSFPYMDEKEIFIEPPDNILHLGEIVVCYQKVVEEAQKEGTLIDQKVIELVTHGGLHLLGKHHDE